MYRVVQKSWCQVERKVQPVCSQPRAAMPGWCLTKQSLFYAQRCSVTKPRGHFPASPYNGHCKKRAEEEIECLKRRSDVVPTSEAPLSVPSTLVCSMLRRWTFSCQISINPTPRIAVEFLLGCWVARDGGLLWHYSVCRL